MAINFKVTLLMGSFVLLAPANANAAVPPAAFATCAVCHSANPGDKPKIGPNLFGVSKRKAGTAPGFVYSSAMKASGISWNRQNLADFIKAPAHKVPGTKMTFGGQPDPKKVNDLVDYLLSLK
ncbi:cytochrome c [Novosphingobium sp. Rr 2-17]|uniref:c-type cytochrome n=1 Tax=Novosphingobium sp. Rr 2-17 TaxID=555793 RepID=UPI0002698EE2|nr:c-type cytochrome [Novosphingobium sp. Rr 2-17]EIZ79296.1 cytochrome c [Novosphingobium sp. Rr 2-17]